MKIDKRIIGCALVAAMGGLLYGFDTAVINGAIPFFSKHFSLSSLQIGWAVSSALVGSILGAITIAKPTDKWGRKRVLIFASTLFAISALGTAIAYAVWMFNLFRFIGGVAVGIASVVSPMYISEISPKEHRGRLIVTFQLSLVIGILVAFFVDYLLVDIGNNNWRYMFLSELIPSLLFGVLLFYVPNSPRWLIANMREEESKKVLDWIYKDSKCVDIEIQSIKSSLNAEYTNEKHSIYEKRYRHYLFMGIAVGFFSQFTGIAIVLYYASQIFSMSGYNIHSSLAQTVILGITNLLFTLLAMVLIDKIGRKKILLIGLVGMFVTLILFSLSFLSTIQGIVPVLLLILFVAFYAVSMGAVVFVLLAEIFPNPIRAQGMAIGSFSNWIVNAIITFLFPVFINQFSINKGIGYTFLIFGIITCIGFVFFKKILKETKNISLEEI